MSRGRKPWLKNRSSGRKGRFVGQPIECKKVLGSDECLEQCRRGKLKICKRCCTGSTRPVFKREKNNS